MSIIIWIIIVAAVCLFSIWRIYWCPWACFPGPKLAALSSWYEWYWEVYRKGQLNSHLRDLHAVFGPVVRYGPKHVHFNDPVLYPDVYRWNPRFGKDPSFYGAPRYSSTFRETNIEKHAIRRQILSRKFSQTVVRQQMPIIERHCDHLWQKLDKLTRTGQKKFNFFNLCRSFAADVLSTYIAGSTFGCMDDDEEGFDGHFIRAIQYTSDTYFDNRNIFLAKWNSILRAFGYGPPPMDKSLDELIYSDGLVDDYLSRKESLKEDKDESVFSILMQTGVGKHFRPLSKPELTAEGRSLLAAGVNTVGFTLSATLFYIARDEKIQLRLQSELDANKAQGTLTDLPYMAACIKEGYRLSGTVKCRLPRVAGREGACIGDYFLPAGTIFGMGTDSCHLNPGVFKSPKKFDPMRWIVSSDTEKQEMNANLHPYGRGTRECLGRHVAHSIICGITAGLFQRYSVSTGGPGKNIDRISTFETLPKGGKIDLHIERR